MKKIVLLTGNRPQHFELISLINEANTISGIVMENKNINEFSGQYYDKFFQYKKNSENKFFGNKYNNISRINTLSLDRKPDNNDIFNFIQDAEPDLILIYDYSYPLDFLSEFNCDKWKIHEGYISLFKGLYCNFHACCENMAEYVCHTLTEYKNDDTGRIIHQTETLFRKEDNVTDRNSRSFRKMIYDLENILNLYNNGRITYYENNIKGKFYTKSDFSEDKIEKLIEKFDFTANKLEGNNKVEFYKQF